MMLYEVVELCLTKENAFYGVGFRMELFSLFPSEQLNVSWQQPALNLAKMYNFAKI